MLMNLLEVVVQWLLIEASRLGFKNSVELGKWGGCAGKGSSKSVVFRHFTFCFSFGSDPP